MLWVLALCVIGYGNRYEAVLMKWGVGQDFSAKEQHRSKWVNLGITLRSFAANSWLTLSGEVQTLRLFLTWS